MLCVIPITLQHLVYCVRDGSARACVRVLRTRNFRFSSDSGEIPERFVRRTAEMITSYASGKRIEIGSDIERNRDNRAETEPQEPEIASLSRQKKIADRI